MAYIQVISENKWIVAVGAWLYLVEPNKIRQCKAAISKKSIDKKSIKGQESDSDKIDNDNHHDEENMQILAIDVCTHRNLIAVCNSLKQLLVYDLDRLQLKHNFKLVKQATVVTFCHTFNDILVADRSGNVTRFILDSTNSDSLGQIILGHVSVIFDMLITSDDKRLITCDRDEKIRISRYPNAYNIENFCLGHTKYVHTLTYIQQDDEIILISGGGDGCINFWRLTNGQLIGSLNCADYLAKNMENIQIKKIIAPSNDILLVIFENIPCLLLLDLRIESLQIHYTSHNVMYFTDFPLDIEKICIKSSPDDQFLAIFDSKSDPAKRYRLIIDNDHRLSCAEIMDNSELCSTINNDAHFVENISTNTSKISSTLPKLVARAEDYAERKRKKSDG